MNFQVISGVGVWRPEAQAKRAVLSTVDMDAGCVGVVIHFYGESDCSMCGQVESRESDTDMTMSLRYDS